MGNKSTEKQLIVSTIMMSLIILPMGLQIIFSPYHVVRGFALLSVIVCSGAIGAFIREWFILKKQGKGASFIDG